MDATLHDMYYNSLFLVRESCMTFGERSRIMLKGTMIPDSILSDWIIPDDLIEMMVQSRANLDHIDDSKWLPVFVFTYAYALYCGESGISDESYAARVKKAMTDWQKIVRALLSARENGIEIPDVLVFDFDDYPRVLSDLGIDEYGADSDPSVS